MSTMLELYRHRFGAGVKARGNGWNGPCPICGGEVGKSDHREGGITFETAKASNFNVNVSQTPVGSVESPAI